MNLNNSYSTQTKKYYKGTYGSINIAANLLDEVDNHKNNIVISPYSINYNLAYIYNAVDNNSRNEIKNYLKKDENKINSEQQINKRIMTSITEENEFTTLFDHYINEFTSHNYQNYNLNNISEMTNEEKEYFQLLLKKMALTYNRLIYNNNLDKEAIVNYTIREKDIITSNYLLKNELDIVLNDYEEYLISNQLINYMEVYTTLDSNKISESFLDKTSIYGVNINGKYSTNYLQSHLKSITNDNIKRIDELITPSVNLNIVNVLYFDYAWEEDFKAYQVYNKEFQNKDGKYSSTQMMFSEEDIYLENDQAKGFIKYFKNKEYSFVGILPNDNGDFSLSTLNLETLIKSARKKSILIGIPKFSYQQEYNLENLHEYMGIKEIYTPKANFTKMTDESIYIDKNILRTTIKIGERGTEDTNITNDNIETFIYEQDIDNIILNRPFAYLILNNKTDEVILIGKVTNL